MKHGLNTDFFRAERQGPSRVPTSGTPPTEWGNSALTPSLSPRRGGCRSSRPAIAMLLLPFPPISAPTTAAARVRNRASASEQAHPWRRTVRQWHPFLPLLGARAGVRAELVSCLPHLRPSLLSVFHPCSTCSPIGRRVRGLK